MLALSYSNKRALGLPTTRGRRSPHTRTSAALHRRDRSARCNERSLAVPKAGARWVESYAAPDQANAHAKPSRTRSDASSDAHARQENKTKPGLARRNAYIHAGLEGGLRNQGNRRRDFSHSRSHTRRRLGARAVTRGRSRPTHYNRASELSSQQ